MDETLNIELCLELFFEVLFEEGELVAQHYWDSGGPGAGADSVTVYKYRDCYFGFNDVASHGPFDYLDEAIKAVQLDQPTSATVWIKIEGKTVFQK